MKKTLLILALSLAVAAPLAAQAPPGGGPPPAGGPGGGPPDQVLADVLGFTEAQLAQLRTLAEARRASADSLRTQQMEAEKALGDALKASSPDAATVGAALLRVEGLRKQLASLDEGFRTSVAGLLTAEQKTKLESLRAAAAAVQAGEALRRAGLL